MIFGYARVSTAEQGRSGYSLEAQIEALKQAGCERVFSEVASGGKADRPELGRLLEQMREGDLLVVNKVDRFSRSLRDLLLFLDKLGKLGARFRSLNDAIDTSSASGRAMMQMIGVFAELERALMKERVQVGLDEARKRGVVGGRPRKLTQQQRDEIVHMVRSGLKTRAECARLFQVSDQTVSRILMEKGDG